MNDDKGLVERLTSTRAGYSGTLLADGTVCYSENEQEHLVNPDGPEAATRIQVLSDRIAVQDAMLSAGSVAMSPHERVRWIDRVRKHLDTSPQESSSNAE